MRTEAIALWAALANVTLVACSTDAADMTASNASEPGLILSDTAGLASEALSSALATRMEAPLALSGSMGAEPVAVAYISLPPGTFPAGVSATIRNRRTAVGLTVAMMNGGFDPFPIPAMEGDSLDIEIRLAGGAAALTFVRTVPGKRPPRVVRTQPPRGKIDVAVNTKIIVIFSEPIDAATLTEMSVHLVRGAIQVAGQVAVGDSAHLTAVFTPATPLQGDTQYQLIATQDVRDVDGEPLETSVTVEFRTGTGPDFGLTGRIAFANWSTISVINADGTGLTRLIGEDAQGGTYMSPAWSPDGSKVAFGSSREGGWDIYVINADGSGLRRLTSHSARDDSPAWSPNGDLIAFTSNRDGDFDIHVMNADGSRVIQVTDHPAEDGDPSWSPDGSQIAFTSNRDGYNELYVINVAGHATRRLTNFPDPEEAIQPIWSPDGSLLVFTIVDGFHGVYVTTAEGGSPTRLTLGGGAPTWSPDGKRIVYANGNLQILNIFSGERRDLGVFGYEPAWSPAPR
jgi:Big-like domain-containing protein/WD40 repeat protein